MATVTEVPNKWRRWLMRLAIFSLFTGTMLTVGITVTAIVAARLFFSIAAGIVSEGANATITALHSGDSEMRLAVLTQLKHSFDAQPAQQFDEHAVAWILPAIEQCETDKDPAVVELAGELVNFIKDHSVSPPR